MRLGSIGNVKSRATPEQTIILIVDDELSVREILAEGLGACGYRKWLLGRVMDEKVSCGNPDLDEFEAQLVP